MISTTILYLINKYIVPICMGGSILREVLNSCLTYCVLLEIYKSDCFSHQLSGADPGEVKWVNFHPPPPFSEPPSFFFFLSLKYSLQTPQPGFGSITILQKFTPHFKILDPRLVIHIYSLIEDNCRFCAVIFLSLSN